jgi:proteasome assembly chaperone (PAC2) family protein
MQKEIRGSPKIFCAASDPETFKAALKLGAKKMVGQIFGVAGLIIGLGSLRGFSGFSLLVETTGTHPDAKGANYLLTPLCRHLNLKVDLSDLEASAEKTKEMLESFGLLRNIKKENKEKSGLRWFV